MARFDCPICGKPGTDVSMTVGEYGSPPALLVSPCHCTSRGVAAGEHRDEILVAIRRDTTFVDLTAPGPATAPQRLTAGCEWIRVTSQPALDALRFAAGELGPLVAGGDLDRKACIAGLLQAAEVRGVDAERARKVVTGAIPGRR